MGVPYQPLGQAGIASPAGIPPLRFNLSHTRGLVACIVAEGIDVGVDVEDRRRPTQGPDIARRCFSARELEAVERLSEEEQEAVFFEYWTLKEAYIKAVGVGISLGLGRFSFGLDERSLALDDPGRQPPRISFYDGLEDDPAAWQFAQFEPTPNYALAAAIRRGAGVDLPIELREVVPGLDPE